MTGTQVLNLARAIYSHAVSVPARPALVIGERTYTYGALADSASRVAAWVRSRCGDSGDALAAPRVGILAARSHQAYAGILGVAWAGGAYVPLNPKQPAERLHSIIRQAGVTALVVDNRGAAPLRELLDGWGDGTPPQVLLADDATLPTTVERVTPWGALERMRGLASPAPVSADHPAYILFTSGTTGVPKGVIIHAGALNCFLAALRSRYQLGPSDRVAQFIELTFDPSVMELFGCWDAGAALHVVPETKVMAPGGFLREREITFLACVPSLVAVMARLRQLSPGALPDLRVTIFGGEQLPLETTLLWRAAAPNSVIDNQYGPTEATVACLVQRIGVEAIQTPGRGTLAIGRPLPGMEAAIVGPDLRFLTTGESGELAVSGPQLAAGYVGDPAQTARRFPMLDHPRLGRSRWYLTGDLACCDEKGQFHCLGRIDNQVKVMGHRVELEEIEAHLRAVAGTEAVAAIGWPSSNGNAAGVVAFVSGARVAPPDIREQMRRRVPAYMLPGRVLPLDELPLSVNGKVDRHALRKLLDEGVATGDAEGRRTVGTTAS